MSYSELARELVDDSRASKDHMSYIQYENLPCSYSTMQRLISTVSKGSCKVKTHNGKLFVIDFSWTD